MFRKLIVVFCLLLGAVSAAWGQADAPRFDPAFQTVPSAPFDAAPLPLTTAPQLDYSSDIPGPPLSNSYGNLPGTCGFDPINDLLDKYCGDGPPPTYLNGYYDPFSSWEFAYGAVAVTPYQLGWLNRQEFTYIPPEAAQGVTGDYQMLDWSGWTRYAALLDEGVLFTGNLNMSSRAISGPTGVALPPAAHFFRPDFQLASTDPGPWNWQLGVTPQINTDLERQLNRDAYMVDARAVVFNKVSPELTLALGFAYWGRNHGNFIPYGGVIWTPDDRWEFRAMFPKSRISYYAGQFERADIWLYGSAEYTLEAFQVTLQDASRLKQRLELQDYRFMVGITAMQPHLGAYLEGGYITDRHANFRGPTQDFGIGDAWTIRTGITF